MSYNRFAAHGGKYGAGSYVSHYSRLLYLFIYYSSPDVGASNIFTCIGALGTPPAERCPSLEIIYRGVSLTVDLCED